MTNTKPTPHSDPIPSPNWSAISTPAKGYAGAAAGAGVVAVAPTGDDDIDGLLFGTKWTSAVTFSFPDSSADYPSDYGYDEPLTGFAPLTTAQKQVFLKAADMVMEFCGISLTYTGTNTADIQIAQSHAADPTAYAYYPWPTAEGGDIWIGRSWDYTDPVFGDYNYLTMLHEFGHALGLKNAHELIGVSDVAVPIEHDALEYTVESYRSYLGGPTTGGYTNEWFGFPTSFMMNDILALQTLYGANYATESGDTVYSWDPATGQQFVNGVGQLVPGNGLANRVLTTIWDGGGTDTYDLSNYATTANIDLNPGTYSITSDVQRAYLGDGHYAQGTVYNAYLFNGDARSLIENAIGGSGSDIIAGNAVDNMLEGRGGDDLIRGQSGNDTILGGAGADRLYGGGGIDTLSYLGATEAVVVNLSTLIVSGGDASGDVIANFENVIGGNGSDRLTGDSGGNELIGRSGNDKLEGGEGSDRLLGGGGIDAVLYVSATSGVTVSLSDPLSNTGEAYGDAFWSIENVFGSAFSDLITGDDLNNRLDGGRGDDTLSGGGGNDVLRGASGRDILIGGLGRDNMSANAGKDVFVFNTIDDSAKPITDCDVILNFAHLKDKIDVSAIDAIEGGSDDAFVLIGAAAFTASGQIRATQYGDDTLLRFNVTGGDAAEMTIRLRDFDASALTQDDFIL